MARLADLEISRVHITLRIFAGLALAATVLFLFYYLPSNYSTLFSPLIPHQYLPYVGLFISDMLSSGIPFLGVLLAVIAFFDILLRGTWTYGIILVVTGLIFIAYDVLLFRNGQLFTLSSSASESAAIYSKLSLEITLIIVVFIISTIISIGRGISLIVRRNHRMNRL